MGKKPVSKIEIIEIFNKPVFIHKQLEPSSFNGDVRFRKYRITVEEIEEPNEVLAGRLQKLWDECDNYHHWTPLKEAAASIGYTLIGQVGSKKIKH